MRPFLFLGGALVLLLAAAYVVYGLQPEMGSFDERGGPVGEVRLFRISKGERFRDIAARLSRESLIRSIGVFKLYALTTGAAQRLQPGAYELSPSMSVPEIAARLTAAGGDEATVTIPEGTTAKDAVALLVEAGVLADDSALSVNPSRFQDRYPYLAGVESLEGLLFPDTYRFRRGSDPEDVIAVLLATFDRKARPMLQGIDKWYERLILASMLEREVPEYTDRTIVAGILERRIAAGMPLQVDATVSYAKCGGAIRSCGGISVSRADLGIPSPFNTYQHTGWTPTPISNPGEAAIRAAIEPRATGYKYYLSASKTGQTVFSETLEEHNRNRARFL